MSYKTRFTFGSPIREEKRIRLQLKVDIAYKFPIIEENCWNSLYA